MKGISIHRRPAGPTLRASSGPPPSAMPTSPEARLPGPASDFHEFFAALYPWLSGHFWWSRGACFHVPPAWCQDDEEVEAEHRSPERDDFRSYVLAAPADGTLRALWRPGFIARYARFLKDDWCELVGVHPPPHDPADAIDLCWREAGRREEVDVVFTNVDAAYWQVFSVRDDILAAVQAHLGGRADLMLRAERSDPGD